MATSLHFCEVGDSNSADAAGWLACELTMQDMRVDETFFKNSISICKPNHFEHIEMNVIHEVSTNSQNVASLHLSYLF